jgi:hypothetical protein
LKNVRRRPKNCRADDDSDDQAHGIPQPEPAGRRQLAVLAIDQHGSQSNSVVCLRKMNEHADERGFNGLALINQLG